MAQYSTRRFHSHWTHRALPVQFALLRNARSALLESLLSCARTNSHACYSERRVSANGIRSFHPFPTDGERASIQ